LKRQRPDSQRSTFRIDDLGLAYKDTGKGGRKKRKEKEKKKRGKKKKRKFSLPKT
jgi:hypothetical protein